MHTYYDSSLENRKDKAKMYDQRWRWRWACEMQGVFLGDCFLRGGDFGFVNGFYHLRHTQCYHAVLLLLKMEFRAVVLSR